MCECMKRADGTWHVDECCADIMNDYHSGKLFDSFKAQIRREVVEEFSKEVIAGLREFQFMQLATFDVIKDAQTRWLAEQEASDE